MAAGNRTQGGGFVPYRKRRPLPGLILLLVLGVSSTYVWVYVMDTSANLSTHACDPPGGPEQRPPGLGQPLEREALERTTPAPPNEAIIQVLNATSRRGRAGVVSESLRQLGFTETVVAKNDPLYGNLDMGCRAQIRFGPQGMATARTLSILEPCAELVRDNRQDATVDLAIGTMFDDLRPSADAKKILQQLAQWSAAHPQDPGGLQSDGTAQPHIDEELLTSANEVSC